MNKFKVGDYVKSVWFDGVKPIVDCTNSGKSLYRIEKIGESINA